jgi:hypothetical protein
MDMSERFLEEMKRYAELMKKFEDALSSVRKTANGMDCECGFEVPLGEGYASGQCYRCEILSALPQERGGRGEG